MNRREFLAGIGATSVALALPLNAADAANPPSTRPAPALAPLAFQPLPLGSVQPEGWLKRQLRLQADALTGHLDEFWPDVGQSQWFGGKAEGWERAPYWLDGFIPLAWVLGDENLKSRAKRHIDYIVAHQRPDGWYSPYPTDPKAKKYDLWSILLINKVLAQYHEATGDPAVLKALTANLKATLNTLDSTPLYDWGKFRWFEGLIPVYYVYSISGEPWLLDLAKKLHAQGFDYFAFYTSPKFAEPTPRRGKWTWEKHVVNAAMAIKAYGLSSRLTRSELERTYSARMLELLDQYHGQVTGMFSGDECLSGKNPLQGTELCAVVEALYSLEHLVSITGQAAFADRLERIAFNALPAAFSPDMWAHQYDQQVNQVQCTINPDHGFSTNGPDSNIYGLEPNYGCCTANLHQGWPKFAAHLWMRTPDQGVAAVAYAPNSARVTIAGTPVRLSVQTDYPFRDTLTVTVSCERPTRFSLLLRIPAWTAGATVRVAGSEQSPAPGSFHRIEREWNGSTELQLRFPMSPRTSRRYNNALTIERGPLVYSLQIAESWTRVNADKPHRELPHGDFEVRPTTLWNYGLVVDEKNPGATLKFSEQPVGDKPFSPEGAGVIATVKGRKLPAWRIEKGWAGETPPSPQASTEPLQELKLIPYGCTNIRITEFPQLES